MKSSGADDRGCPRLLQKSNKYIAGQLGFLLPLAKKSDVLNTDKNIEVLMAAAAGEQLRTEGGQRI